MQSSGTGLLKRVQDQSTCMSKHSVLRKHKVLRVRHIRTGSKLQFEQVYAMHERVCIHQPCET